MRLQFVIRCALLSLAMLCLCACGGGSKLVKRPTQDAASLLQAPAVVQAEDGRVRASFHALVLRNGPGSWAKNASWDEYYLQVTNVSAAPLQLTGAAVVDSNGTHLPAMADRGQLVAASKKSVARYRSQGVKLTAGPGSAGLMLAGAGVTVAGVGTAVGAAYGSMLGTGAAAGATAAASAMLIAGPAIAVAGIVRAVQNGQVNDELGRRAPDWPLVLAPGETRTLDLFVPLAPAPSRLELDYQAGAPHRLNLDVQAPLAGLHMLPSAAQATPR